MTSVTTAETTKEPRRPRRLEKNTNTNALYPLPALATPHPWP
jgi:hypothetical protein